MCILVTFIIWAIFCFERDDDSSFILIPMFKYYFFFLCCVTQTKQQTVKMTKTKKKQNKKYEKNTIYSTTQIFPLMACRKVSHSVEREQKCAWKRKRVYLIFLVEFIVFLSTPRLMTKRFKCTTHMFNTYIWFHFQDYYLHSTHFSLDKLIRIMLYQMW